MLAKKYQRPLNQGWTGGTIHTIHSLLVDFIDSVIAVHFELILLMGVLNLSNLVVIVDEIAKKFDVGGKDGILWQRMRKSTEHGRR
jgi:cytochrome b